MPLLLDATIWVAAARPENRFHRDSATLLESRVPFAALDLTLFEVANALGVKLGRKDRAKWLVDGIITRCGDRLIRVDIELIASAVEIAAEYDLTAYDAAYVAAARGHGWTLVSADIADLVSKGLAVAPDAAV